MAGKKRKKDPQLVRIAVVLAVLVIAAIALVRYLGTEKGEALLLDAGVGDRYAGVQRNLEMRIFEGLGRAGVPPKSITVKRQGGAGSSGPAELRVTVSRDLSLIRINSEIDAAVRLSGGRIRSCAEQGGGKAIVMEVGTRRRVTHRCVIRKGRKAVRKETPGAENPVVAIVVDDFGFFNNRLVREFLSLEIPLTVSVIPGLKYSERICESAREHGKDVLCHLPMEPEKGADDVGDIPLVRVAMKSKEIEQVVERALDSTPGIIGINNHMGSRATADRRVMQAVLRVCRRRDILFFDSMTTPHSVACEVAREAGVPTTSNDIFLDNSEEEIREKMHKMLAIAARRGSAVGILHVRRKTLEHLKWMIGEARKRGVRFQTISERIENLTVAAKEGGRK